MGLLWWDTSDTALLTDPGVEGADEERLNVLVLKGGMEGESLLGLLRTTPAGAAGDWG